MAYRPMPDIVERCGSLSLRSNHMNYSGAILNSNCTGLEWYQAREADPKDFDTNKDPVRDFFKATYTRIGTDTNGLPKTTYQDFCDQLNLKEYVEQDITKHLITDISKVPLESETGKSDSDIWAILPRHKPGYNMHHMETTHHADFKPPYPYNSEELKPLDFPDHSMAYKNCLSQFTDTADYRRTGRNTWQDESGVYSNSHLKVQCPTYRGSTPFRTHLAER